MRDTLLDEWKHSRSRIVVLQLDQLVCDGGLVIWCLTVCAYRVWLVSEGTRWCLFACEFDF